MRTWPTWILIILLIIWGELIGGCADSSSYRSPGYTLVDKYMREGWTFMGKDYRGWAEFRRPQGYAAWEYRFVDPLHPEIYQTQIIARVYDPWAQ